MTETPTPGELPPPPAPAPAKPTATRSDKLRLILILGGIGAFLAIVLFLVRDNQSAGDLAVGTCFDVPAAATDISTVTRHECTEAHDAEVFHVGEYTEGTDYPISLSLDRYLDGACVPAFATYTGADFDSSEDLTVGYFYPSRDGWDSGDRTITCYIVRVDEGKMTESLRASTGS
jgi:Septum formation